MRFKIGYIQSGEEMLDLAFRHGRGLQPVVGKRVRKKERWSKEIARVKLEGISDELAEKLHVVGTRFPSFEELPFFYQDLMDATIDLDRTRKRLGNIKRAGKLVQKMRREHLGKIFRSKTDRAISSLSHAYYGRITSIMKKINADLKALELARRELERLPNVRTDCFTVLLAGFPNVGKTTVLSRLTGSMPEIAAYPFTTKGLKLGYFRERFFDVQVIDTPGLLDRQKVNTVEQKALSALRNLDGVVVFVVDASETSGFGLAQQQKLLEALKKELRQKTFWTALNKVDIAHPTQLEQTSKLFPDAIETRPDDATVLRAKIVENLTEQMRAAHARKR
ncbi:MAG: GTPase [Candidatus Diapherotrites archaeon]|nr:GTPase [Candidatus Diapherotrites archaeon]